MSYDTGCSKADKPQSRIEGINVRLSGLEEMAVRANTLAGKLHGTLLGERSAPPKEMPKQESSGVLGSWMFRLDEIQRVVGDVLDVLNFIDREL